MNDVRDNAFSFLDDWYGRLEDIIDDFKEHGFDVLNATSEFIDIADKNDKEYVVKLGGTARTITINKIECLNESLIPIQEYWDEDDWDDDELASIYGGDTAQSQKDIAEDEIAALKSEAFDDWNCETLEQAISWVQNYDLEESTKVNNEINKDDSKKVLEDDSSEENDELIVVEYVTSGNDEEDIQRRLAKIKNAIDYYENNNDDTLYNLIDKLEDELEDLKDINMKKISTVDENKDTLIEQDTFGNYEENIFNALDNIEVLASSYEELNADSLKTLISRLEDELDTLKKINMKLITGIKQYTL